jgi:hypothetical protein
MTGPSTSGSPSATTNQQGSPGVLTPPRQAPGTEASTGNGATGGSGGRGPAGGAQGGRAGQNAAAGGGAGGPEAQPSPHQAELMRKSERIDRTIMRSICIGCGDSRSSGKPSARKEAPAQVDVQAPLRQ